MSILFRKADKKRAEYLRTVEALRSMSPTVALDLEIFIEDAEKIAHKAVYG